MIPSAAFAASVGANVAYWAARTRTLDRERIRIVDRERQNLLRAADFGLGLEETWRKTTELIMQCYGLIDQLGYSRGWISLFERSLRGCPEGESELKGQLLGQVGTLYRRSRLLDQAVKTHLSEERLGYELGDEMLIASSQMHLAFAYYRLRDYERGGEYAQAAVSALKENAPDSILMAASLSAAGLIATNRGELSEAEEYLLESVDLYRRHDRRLELGRVLLNLGNVLENAGRFDEAIARYREAEIHLASAGSKIEEMKLYMSQGTLLYHQGRYKEAEECFRKADSDYVRQWGTPYQTAQIKMNLANVLLAQGKLDDSEAFWRECISEWRHTGAKLMLANSLGGLAETLAAKEDYKQAIQLFDEALAIVVGYPDDAWARKLEEMFTEERQEALINRKKSDHLAKE